MSVLATYTYTEITDDSGVIGYSVYCNNTNVCTEAIIPSKYKELPVLSIYPYAFYGCTSLTSVTIGNSVTSIGDCAFDSCSSLTSVVIPNSVTLIGSSAFFYCSSLTSITIPDGVTSIGGGAFEGCSLLTSITIPGNVTSIGNRVFYDCTSLKYVTLFPKEAPVLGSVAFAGISTDAKFYCYSSAENSYKSASNWNAYAAKLIANDLGLTLAKNAEVINGKFVKKEDLEEVADGKLNKIENTSTEVQVYAKSPTQNPYLLTIGYDPRIASNGKLCQYHGKTLSNYMAAAEPQGSLLTCMPTFDYQCTPKKYVDDKVGYKKVTLNGGEKFVICGKPSGTAVNSAIDTTRRSILEFIVGPHSPMGYREVNLYAGYIGNSEIKKLKWIDRIKDYCMDESGDLIQPFSYVNLHAQQGILGLATGDDVWLVYEHEEGDDISDVTVDIYVKQTFLD